MEIPYEISCPRCGNPTTHPRYQSDDALLAALDGGNAACSICGMPLLPILDYVNEANRRMAAFYFNKYMQHKAQVERLKQARAVKKRME